VVQYALGIQFRRHVPLMGATRRQVQQGALFAVDYDPHAVGEQAALIANHLLAGAKGAPTLAPARPRLSVNRATAHSLRVDSSAFRALGAELVE